MAALDDTKKNRQQPGDQTRNARGGKPSAPTGGTSDGGRNPGGHVRDNRSGETQGHPRESSDEGAGLNENEEIGGEDEDEPDDENDDES
jgi:hypothetical protein